MTYKIRRDGRPSKWIFKFDCPDSAAFGRIQEILEAMPVATHDDRSAPKDRRRKHAIELPLRDLFVRIRESLAKEHAENSDEFATGNVGFRYGISPDVNYEGNIAVLTRLFDRSGAHGEILYGCEIRRVGNDRFLLWDDE